MNLPTKLQTEAPSGPRAQTMAAPAAAEAKPRKVNSEVRKQQNRIASRNYREKRKRKLQQLQQLLGDDDPGERQIDTRSTSPYEDRSCSGSVDYEPFAASPSPHITTMPVTLSSPQPGQAILSSLTWSPVLPATQHTHTFTHSYSEPPQGTSTYSVRASTTIGYPESNVLPWASSAGYVTPGVTHYSSYSSHVPTWPASEYVYPYPQIIHQHETPPSTNFCAPSMQYSASADPPAGVVADPYDRRNHSYNPR